MPIRFIEGDDFLTRFLSQVRRYIVCDILDCLAIYRDEMFDALA